ncbi:triacylglycerol lipase [Nocardioides sp. Soil797]|nr:triacylglycerol lipase [Nocardioides sp. Soil797]
MSQSAGADRPVPPRQDPFYRYSGKKPLRKIAPGAVLKTRHTKLHFASLPLPVRAEQLLYRTTDQLGRPTTTVTTILHPGKTADTKRLVSYQSFYDSLTPDCEPSYVLAGGLDRGLIASAEVPIMGALLAQGYTVVTSDFEGQKPAFASGKQYGRATLDGIRAALSSKAVDLPKTTRVAMMGYSGGGIATEWATELAPRYAPDVNKRLVGSALGGLLVHPAHNLGYVEGSALWAGVMPMAMIGMARGNNVDLTPYLSEKGRQVFAKQQEACFFTDVYGQYPGLKFAQLVKPQYADPTKIAPYVRLANQQIMGRTGTPTVPLFVRQATNGILEGTRNGGPGVGSGDGVMIAGDVRTLARQFCANGVKVDHREYPLLSHVPAGVKFTLDAMPWLAQRFAGKAASSTCGSIKPGNSLAPIK